MQPDNDYRDPPLAENGFRDSVGGFHKDGEGIAPNGHPCSPCYSSTCATCPAWWFMRRRDFANESVRARKEAENHKETIGEFLARKRLAFLFFFFAVMLGASLVRLGLVDGASLPGLAAFCAAVGTFAVMSYEDSVNKTVDVRKAGFLALAFLLCSTQGVSEYLFLLAFYLLFFHVLLAALGIFATLSLAKPKAACVRRPAFSGRAAITKAGVPFLPCFMGGILLSCVVSVATQKSIPAIAMHYADKLFDLNALLVSSAWKPSLLGILLFALVVLKGVEALFCQGYEKVSVMGEGDALTLPIFGAFLGTPLFFFSLGLGFLMAFLFMGDSAKKEKGNSGNRTP